MRIGGESQFYLRRLLLIVNFYAVLQVVRKSGITRLQLLQCLFTYIVQTLI